MHTSRIGLVLTAPALFGDPATLAREISSLDHVSKGRGRFRTEYESATFRGNLGLGS